MSGRFQIAVNCFLSVLILWATTVTAQDEMKKPQDSTFGNSMFLRGALGYSFGSSDDLNDIIQQISDAFSFWDSSNFEDFGGTLTFDGELGINVSRYVALSVSFTKYQTIEATSRASIFDFNVVTLETFDFEYDGTDELSMWDFGGNLILRPQGGSGLVIGLFGGVGGSAYKTSWGFRDFSSPLITGDFSARGEFDGTGFSGGAFLGYEYTFPSNMLIFAHAGYRIHKVDDPEGTWTVSDSFGIVESGSGTLDEFVTDVVGATTNGVSLDYDAPYVRVGFGFQFPMDG